MSKYATAQKFGGQRASVGRPVLFGVNRSDMRAKFVDGAIAMIRDDDAPIIRYNTPDGAFLVQAPPYFDARTEDEVELMSPGQWCWLPRV